MAATGLLQPILQLREETASTIENLGRLLLGTCARRKGGKLVQSSRLSHLVAELSPETDRLPVSVGRRRSLLSPQPRLEEAPVRLGLLEI